MLIRWILLLGRSRRSRHWGRLVSFQVTSAKLRFRWLYNYREQGLGRRQAYSAEYSGGLPSVGIGLDVGFCCVTGAYVTISSSEKNTDREPH